MSYALLKITHIITAALALGGGLALAITAYLMRSLPTGRVSLEKINLVIVIPAYCLQAITGFSIISVQHYSVHTLWVEMTLLLYPVAVIAWLAASFAWYQKKEKRAFGCACLCWGTVAVMVFFMANRVM